MWPIPKMTLRKVFPACDFMKLDQFGILNKRRVLHMIDDRSLVKEILQFTFVELIVISHGGFKLLLNRGFRRTNMCVEAL
jgi:hypothetical protein